MISPPEFLMEKILQKQRLSGKDSKFDSHKKEPLSTVPDFKYWNYNPCLRV
jgi:hypothetical protein